MLTCIIPIRLCAGREEVIERLDFLGLDSELPIEVDFLVVDDGSPAGFDELIQKRCAELGIGYLHLETTEHCFSVGRCRNAGAMHARTPFVFMQDVDLMPTPGFYRALLNEIEIQGMWQNAKHFLMVPYVFLSEAGTRRFAEVDPSQRRQFFLHAALSGNEHLIEKISSGTSANVYNRHWYLSRGGNSPDFEGWGYEDLECNSRLVRHLNLFPIPREWLLEKYNFNTVVAYRSWKAPYRLMGDLLWFKGISLFHAWHPTGNQDDYTDRKWANRTLFLEKMAAFERDRTEPEALPDASRGRTLLMRTNAFTSARDIRPALGQIVPAPAELLSGQIQLSHFVRENRIDRVMFHNPYASTEMLDFFRAVRREKIPYWVAERGALPDSCFFDPTGFLGDGSSYHPDKWDYPLELKKREDVQRYIARVREENPALEKQPDRVGGIRLREQLGLQGRFILFLALQRPTDSVCRYFAGQMGSYENFITLMNEVGRALPPEWVIVAKRHPLETADPLISGARFVNEAHIHDLLEMSDAAITFNSGVGVLSMLWELPLLIVGDAFYGDPRLNSSVHSAADVQSALTALKPPEPETRLRFLSYLVNEFYSFGAFTTKPVKMPDGTNMTATMDIRYSVLRGLTPEPIVFEPAIPPTIGWNSPLFDRYRYAEGVRERYQSKLSRGQKLLRKLREHPDRFFLESKNPLLRLIGRWYFRRS